MQQIEKSNITRKAWNKRESEMHKLTELMDLLSSGKKIVRRVIKKYNSVTVTNFIWLCADLELLLDQFRVKYGPVIENVKVIKLGRIDRKINKKVTE